MNTLEFLTNINQYDDNKFIFISKTSLFTGNIDILILDSFEYDENQISCIGIKVKNFKNFALFYKNYYKVDEAQQAKFLEFYLKNGYHDLKSFDLNQLVKNFSLLMSSFHTIYIKKPWSESSNIWIFNICRDEYLSSFLKTHYTNIFNNIIDDNKLEYFLELHVIKSFLRPDYKNNINIAINDILHYAEYDG